MVEYCFKGSPINETPKEAESKLQRSPFQKNLWGQSERKGLASLILKMVTSLDRNVSLILVVYAEINETMTHIHFNFFIKILFVFRDN
jgi:hypothetical protein